MEEEIAFEVKGDLKTCCGRFDKAKGEVERDVETEGAVIKKDELQAKIEIYLPALGVGVTNLATAKFADVRFVLSRGAADYAKCSLVFNGIRKELDDGLTRNEAEHKLDMRAKSKKATLRMKRKKGVCDIDLATSGVQPGLPEMFDGDIATVRVNGLDMTQATVELDN